MNFVLRFVLMPLSRLPYGVLYGISSLLSLLLVQWGGYRRQVIRGNIERSFPGQSAAEHRAIERAFGKHFGDLVVESIKHFTAREDQLSPRMVYSGIEVLNRLHESGRHVVIAGGHQNNWELYAVTANRPLKHQLTAIYKRLSNPVMDRAMRESRERFGLSMIPTIEAKSWAKTHLAPEAHPKQAVVFGFDQSPADPLKSWWTTFLKQETAWYWGMEQFARTHDMAVVFGHIRKEKRGYYSCHYELITDQPRALEEGDILRLCIDRLEEDIHREPAHWLWTHKRWKHRRPADAPLQPRTK